MLLEEVPEERPEKLDVFMFATERLCSFAGGDSIESTDAAKDEDPLSFFLLPLCVYMKVDLRRVKSGSRDSSPLRNKVNSVRVARFALGMSHLY
jgi:hypothetical protein